MGQGYGGLEGVGKAVRQNAERGSNRPVSLHSACAIAYDVGLLKSTFGATLADSGAVNKG